MNLVDAGIIVFALALGAIGYERGLIASALPLVGFVGGAALGARIGPALLPDGSESRYAPVVAVAIGIVIGVFVAVALEGVGQAIRARLGRGAGGALDGVAGGALLAGLALLICWGFGAVALHAGGDGARDLRRAVQSSAILGALNDVMPPSGPLLNVLRRVDPTAAVRGPDADVAAPDAGAARDPDVRAAGDSTVKVLGTSCGLGVAGSGWVAGPGLVVTNAHVVAGEDDTTATPNGGAALDAIAVHYDTRNDLALLRVPGLDAQPLELAARRPRGIDAAAIGYPGNGSLTFIAARLGRTGRVTSQDSYGRGPVQRRMTPFRADVQPGSSGGPVVDRDGDVLTTVFAASTGGGRDDGLGVPNEVVAKALGGGLEPTDTGPCTA
ncbi:MAG: trypsin-like serine protease [Solirubrobacterales bacterium]|nr:trypsin-like serine protease [Solirubrobacterales bacterium]